MCSAVKQTWVQIPIPSIGGVTWAKLLQLSGPQFFIIKIMSMMQEHSEDYRCYMQKCQDHRVLTLPPSAGYMSLGEG